LRLDTLLRGSEGLNETGNVLTPDEALDKISAALEKAKEEYEEAEAWLRRWYSEARAQGRVTENNEDD